MLIDFGPTVRASHPVAPATPPQGRCIPVILRFGRPFVQLGYNHMGLLQLPCDVLSRIMQYLPLGVVLTLSALNTLLRKAQDDESLWSGLLMALQWPIRQSIMVPTCKSVQSWRHATQRFVSVPRPCHGWLLTAPRTVDHHDHYGQRPLMVTNSFPSSRLMGGDQNSGVPITDLKCTLDMQTEGSYALSTWLLVNEPPSQVLDLLSLHVLSNTMTSSQYLTVRLSPTNALIPVFKQASENSVYELFSTRLQRQQWHHIVLMFGVCHADAPMATTVILDPNDPEEEGVILDPHAPSVSLYLDGQLAGRTRCWHLDRCWLQSLCVKSQEALHGRIQEMCVWNQCLSSGDVKHLFDWGPRR